jgi:hypothetical protein
MSSGWRAFGAHVARWGSSIRLLCGIEQIVWLCNDNDYQLKGIASFLSHFSSSVTASQPLSRIVRSASRAIRSLSLNFSHRCHAGARLPFARRRQRLNRCAWSML